MKRIPFPLICGLITLLLLPACSDDEPRLDPAGGTDASITIDTGRPIPPGVTYTPVNDNTLILNDIIYLITSDRELSITGYMRDRQIRQLKLYATVTIDGHTYQTTAIHDDAFRELTGIPSIDIPSTVRHIGDRAFEHSGFSHVNFPRALTTIGQNAFYHCTGLTQAILPDGLREIYFSAFQSCEALTTIHLPSTLDEIGAAAFKNCPALRDLKIPASINYIRDSSFSLCNSLTDINIPDNITRIGEFAFANHRLTNITIGKNVKTIGVSAFQGPLKQIYCHPTAPPVPEHEVYQVMDIFIYDRLREATLHVPAASLQAYKDSGWGRFKNIIGDL